MIPFENSSGGVVWPHLEHLMQENEPLQIAAAVRLKVQMCAGGKPGTKLSDVQRAYSHPKGLQQTTKFLGALGPDVKKIECASTVDGALKASSDNDVASIALASRSALLAHGLDILKEDIADLPGKKNVTKFFVVHRNGVETLPRYEASYHAAIITPHNARGVLAKTLALIDRYEMDLVSLHSRSIDDHEYAFYMEMKRQGSNNQVERLNRILSKSAFLQSVKWLGSWDEQLQN